MLGFPSKTGSRSKRTGTFTYTLTDATELQNPWWKA